MADAVLVVDDSVEVRAMIDQSLHLAGYAPISAPNGLEALRLLKTGAPVKVILLDLMMPVMDGWAFRRQQLSDPEIAHIPVIAFSAAENLHYEELQPAALFRKPLPLDAMLDVIRRLCNASPTSDTREAHFTTSSGSVIAERTRR
jgi:CheY-like chemotaxis protein